MIFTERGISSGGMNMSAGPAAPRCPCVLLSLWPTEVCMPPDYMSGLVSLSKQPSVCRRGGPRWHPILVPACYRADRAPLATS